MSSIQQISSCNGTLHNLFQIVINTRIKNLTDIIPFNKKIENAGEKKNYKIKKEKKNLCRTLKNSSKTLTCVTITHISSFNGQCKELQ